MGPEETGTRRLNLAQAFNPMGLLTGMLVAKNLIQARLDPRDAAVRGTLSAEEFEAVKAHDLEVLSAPYIFVGGLILAVFVLIALVKMPANNEETHSLNLWKALQRIFSKKRYREGVVTQLFYVGAQIMCWTFIVQYGQRIFMEQHGMTAGEAAQEAQFYNIIAMTGFVIFRFVFPFVLKFVHPGKLLMSLAMAAMCLTPATILLQNIGGLYTLIGISACMSLMFPTIYGISLF